MLSGHPSSTGTHYGGQYASVYGGSVAISSALEVSERLIWELVFFSWITDYKDSDKSL